MELDTGAAVSVISKSEFDKQLRPLVNLEPTILELRTYTGETERPTEVCKVRMEYQVRCIQLYVLPGKGPALFGREWLPEIQLRWPLLHLETKRNLDSVPNTKNKQSGNVWTKYYRA